MGILNLKKHYLLSCQTSQLTRSENASTRLLTSETCRLLLTSITARVPLLTPLSPRPVLLPVRLLAMPEPPIPERMNKREVSPLNPPVYHFSSSQISSSKERCMVTLSTLLIHQVTSISLPKSPLPLESPMVPSSSSITLRVSPSKLRPC